MVVTIARQFGSGGRKIGKKIADKLGMPFYDKKLITMAAKESGIDPEVVRSVDEKATNSLLYALSLGAAATFDSTFHIDPQIPINDKLFLIQHDIIKKVSSAPCVIVGRCSDYILRNRSDCIKLFIYADMEDRIKYAKEVYRIPDEKVRSVINRTDKSRADYYNYYSDRIWGDPSNYDLCINSGKLGIENTAGVIISYIEKRGLI